MIWQPSKQQALLFLAVLVAVTLLFLDFRTPVEQTFATTAGGVVEGRDAHEIFRGDMASGNMVGKLGAVTLTAQSTPVYERIIPGMWNDTDMYSVTAVRFNSALDRFEGSSSDYDFDNTESLAFSMLLRVTSHGGQGLFGKRDAADSGWVVTIASTGLVQFFIDDGTTTVVNTSANDIRDGALHEIRIEFNVTTGNMILQVDGETPVTKTMPVLSASNTQVFSIGQIITWAGSANFDMLQLAAFKGADAEGFISDTHVMNHATDPTGLLTKYTRDSLCCPIVGDDPAYGLRVGRYSKDQFASGYKAAFAHASKLGMIREVVASNLCLHSEDLTDAVWVKSGTNESGNVTEAPDGQDTMDSLTATATNGTVEQAIVTVAETWYTQSFFVDRNGGSDVSGRLIMYDLSNSVELDSVSFTAGDKVARPRIIAKTNVGQISTGFRIEIDTDTESIFAWGMDFKQEVWLTSYIPTTTAIATRDRIDVEVANPGANTVFKSIRGEVSSTFVCHGETTPVGAQNRTIIQTAATANDRYQIQLHANERPYSLFRAGDISIAVNDFFGGTIDATAETTYRMRWDSENDLPGHTVNNDCFVNGVREEGTDRAPWVSGLNAVLLTIGAAGGATLPIEGVMATLGIYDRARPDVLL